MEILRSRVGVSQRVNDIIVAENQRRSLERDFKRVLNVPGLEMNSPDAILPTTHPALSPLDLDSGRLVEAALKNRMDLLIAQLQVAISLVNRDVARNQLLPDVSLFFEGSRTTLGLTSRDVMNHYKDGPQENWTGGVRVSIPIGEIAPRARYRAASLQHILSVNTLEQRKRAIEQDVYDAIDGVVETWQQIQAAGEEIDMTQRIYEGEQQLFERGIRTSTEVLDAAQFVANAKIHRISAISGFEIAKVQLAYAVGAHLGYDRVDLVPYGDKPPKSHP
jgi:outer membrane protein TolC